MKSSFSRIRSASQKRLFLSLFVKTGIRMHGIWNVSVYNCISITFTRKRKNRQRKRNQWLSIRKDPGNCKNSLPQTNHTHRVSESQRSDTIDFPSLSSHPPISLIFEKASYHPSIDALWIDRIGGGGGGGGEVTRVFLWQRFPAEGRERGHANLRRFIPQNDGGRPEARDKPESKLNADRVSLVSCFAKLNKRIVPALPLRLISARNGRRESKKEKKGPSMHDDQLVDQG